MEIINKITNLHLHDTPVSGLAFDFVKNEMCLSYDKYVEKTKDYTLERLVFIMFLR